MNRPLALVHGELALPRLWPLDGLPPPFGVQRRKVSNSRRAPRPVLLNAAQQAIRDAVQRRTPAARPPGPAFLFLYKLPSPPDLSNRFADELAEAKRYLQTDRSKPQSSRSDHVLGATIFVACSIALAWLLATCSTSTNDRSANIALARPAAPLQAGTANARSEEQGKAESPRTKAEPVAPAQTVAPKETPPSVKREASDQRTQSTQPAKADSREATARYSARTERSAIVPRVTHQLHTAPGIHAANRAPARTKFENAASVDHSSAQPDWTVRATKKGSVEQSALTAWAAQQRMANTTTAAPTPTTRARIATPVNPNADWNGHMTQRRVTDDPDAFQSSRD